MFVHGDNLSQKETHKTKYLDNISRQYLAEIRPVYEKWKADNVELKGPFSEESDDDINTISERVRLFNEYKDYLDQQHYAENFDSRSNLHSSVLEEFVYFLFKDLVEDLSENALIGKSHSFKDIFFQSSSFIDMVENPNMKIEKKDHDFVIGVDIEVNLKCPGKGGVQVESFQIPAVAIECKTYLDKTMLEGASNAAEQLMVRNPNAMYFVVSEWVKLTDKVNLKKYKVDQIYILRKQKNTDREFRYLADYEKNPIYSDVTMKLFNSVRNHLTDDWQGGIADALEDGVLK